MNKVQCDFSSRYLLVTRTRKNYRRTYTVHPGLTPLFPREDDACPFEQGGRRWTNKQEAIMEQELRQQTEQR